jgi:hypothetical protein
MMSKSYTKKEKVICLQTELHKTTLAHQAASKLLFFFFFISNSNSLKAQRGTTLVHRRYTRESLKYLNYYLSAYTKICQNKSPKAKHNLNRGNPTNEGGACPDHAKPGLQILGMPWYGWSCNGWPQIPRLALA